MLAGVALITVCTQSGLFLLNLEPCAGKVWGFTTLGPQVPLLSTTRKGIWEEELGCFVQIAPCLSFTV